MDKKVTPRQIEILYAFTIKHYVEYYDLQTELVDHLANAIETRWITQPNLSFEDALNAEFKKFGIFGFTELVERRQLAMHKRYRKIIWGYAKDFLRLPKILICLVGVVAAYQLLATFPYVLAIFAGVIFLVFVGRFIAINRRLNKLKKATGKRWMFQDNIYRCAGSSAFFYPGFQFTRYEAGEGSSPILLALAAVLMVAFALYSYIALFVIPARAQEHMEAAYPEYKMEMAS